MINLTFSIVLTNICPQPNFNSKQFLQKKLWFRRKEVLWIYRGFVFFASDGRCLSRNWMHATTYWWIARVRHYPFARFSQWQSSGLFQGGLLRVMAVHGAQSESSTFKESLVSDLGYRAFAWCCLSALGECMACLLQHRSTSKRHLVHVWEPTSWRLQIRSATRSVSQQQLEGCKFWRRSASSASLEHSAHRECYGTPHDEDKSCSRSIQPFLNLPESITRHNNYFNITFGTFCKESSSLQEKAFQ